MGITMRTSIILSNKVKKRFGGPIRPLPSMHWDMNNQLCCFI